jgi:hypothetical protein
LGRTDTKKVVSDFETRSSKYLNRELQRNNMYLSATAFRKADGRHSHPLIAVSFWKSHKYLFGVERRRNCKYVCLYTPSINFTNCFRIAVSIDSVVPVLADMELANFRFEKRRSEDRFGGATTNERHGMLLCYVLESRKRAQSCVV